MNYTKEYFDRYLKLEDGRLYWKSRDRSEFSSDRIFKSWNSRYPGLLAETTHEPKPGYKCKVTRLNKRLFKTHRIIFCMHYGFMPDVVDHIDGNSLNNNPLNLRESTRSQNSMNMKVPSDNTTGYKGVTYDKSRSKYMVQISHGGIRVNGGRFNTAKEAALAYNELAKKYHGEFAKINEV